MSGSETRELEQKCVVACLGRPLKGWEWMVKGTQDKVHGPRERMLIA